MKPRRLDAPSVAAHPRAAHRVAQCKAWSGLAGFALGAYLSLASHAPADAVLRGLLAGVICYLAAWASAVFLWRRLVAAELNQAEHALIEHELARRDALAGKSSAQVAGGAADQLSDIRRTDRESVRD